jgi:predicted MPP superfamily phosphohydrolase
MKQDDYIIALGDNIDRREKCNVMAQKLNDLTKNYNVLWTKGNHDKEACFSFLAPKRYYYVDVQDWRFLIIDNADWFNKDQRSEHSNDIGMISAEEMAWIKDSLKTDKKVLISMHVPLWSKGDGNDNYAVRSDYVDFKKMLEDSGNVKYVLSGHYHNANWNHEENGIHYYILPSIDQQNFEGAHLSLDIE